MPISSERLRIELDRLARDDAAFEAFAGDYAAALDPHRYGALHTYGHGIHGRTVRGWPDLFQAEPDGRINAVSVMSSIDRRYVGRHLRRDVERITQRNVASFLFIAWGPTPAPELVADCVARLSRAGLGGDAVQLIFGPDLLRSLSRARFRAVVLRHLEISTSIAPFQDDRSPELFADDTTTFRPTRAEYEAELVHRPAIVDEVLDRFEHEQAILIRGEGAAGKTVLATHVALSARWSAFFYLRLTGEESGISEALNVISGTGEADVLFVVDDVHLAEPVARAIYDHILRYVPAARLLLVGRVWTPEGAPEGGASLAPLEEGAITVRASPRDLGGVAGRLLARRRLTLEGVHDETFERWESTFGGDLLAFSLALEGRLELDGLRAVLRTGWELHQEDALRYLRRRYVERCEERERRDLLRIAAVGMIELTCYGDVLEAPLLPHSTQHGVVLDASTTSVGARRWRLVHAGLGRLLTRAVGLDEDETRDLVADTVGRSLRMAYALTAHPTASRIVDARDAVRRAMESPGAFRALLSGHTLEVSTEVIHGLERAGYIERDVADVAVSREPGALIGAVARGRAEDLMALLVFARSRPRVAATLAALARDGRLPLASFVSGAAVAGKFHVVAHLLEAVAWRRRGDARRSAGAERDDELVDFRRELTKVLMTDEARAAIHGGVPELPSLAYLSRLLEAAHANAPGFYSALVDDLTTGPAAAPLAERIVRRPDDALGRVLYALDLETEGRANGLLEGMAESSSGALARAISDLGIEAITAILRALDDLAPQCAAKIRCWLATDDGTERLLRSVLSGDAGRVVHLLREGGAIGAALPRLMERLSTPTARDELARRLTETDIGPLANLAEMWPSASDVIRQIDLDAWRLNPYLATKISVADLASTLRTLDLAGRPDLAESLADAVIRDAPGDRDGASHGLRSVTHVLRRSALSAPEKLMFLDRVARPHVAAAYYEHGAAGLANALYSVWSLQPTEVVEWFVRAELSEAIRRDWSELAAEDPPPDADDDILSDLQDALRLRGVAALFGVVVPDDAGPPGEVLIASVRAPIAGRGHAIGKAQLILGLLVAVPLAVAADQLDALDVAIAESFAMEGLTGRSIALSDAIRTYVNENEPDRAALLDQLARLRHHEPALLAVSERA